jgi:hypothetical protein
MAKTDTELIRKDLGVIQMTEECVVCGSPTTKQQENESWDCMDYVCYDSDCEESHSRETRLPTASDGNEGIIYDY